MRTYNIVALVREYPKKHGRSVGFVQMVMWLADCQHIGRCVTVGWSTEMVTPKTCRFRAHRACGAVVDRSERILPAAQHMAGLVRFV